MTQPRLPASVSAGTFSYLGPPGTFTEVALRLAPQARGKHWKAVNNVGEALSDVTSGQSEAAMIAVENSIEGGVTASQDALATIPGLRIIGEFTVPISFSLAVRPGMSLQQVRSIAAHPVAYGQCRRWLSEHLPGHAHIPALSNVASAGALFESGAPVDAAITPPTIREQIQVDVLAEHIEDNRDSRTRFALVSMARTLPPRTGADKTSIIVELPKEGPGALLHMLEQFATRGVNLSMITSRPIPERVGSYRFVMDLDGHLRDARVTDALLGLRRYSERIVFLGSYPRADQLAVTVAPGDTDEHYAKAEAWLEGLVDPVSE